MATPALLEEQDEQQQTSAQPDAASPNGQQGQEATADDPNKNTPQEARDAVGLSLAEQEELMSLRKKLKQRWAADRRTKVRHVRRCFEVLHNRPFTVLAADGFSYTDPFEDVLNGNGIDDDEDLYRANDNIYQMLEGSFVAALSRSQSKTRYMPDNADDETDVATARRASDAMAYIERRNKIKRMQKRELKHLFTSGCYFSHVRYLVDANRAGITKNPIIEMVPTEVAPEHYECKKCGQDTPASSLGPFIKKMCPQCRYPLGEDDFYPAVTIPLPKKTGYSETPNGMVAMDVYGALNVDADPYAQDLTETPLLDLETDPHVGQVRAAYPKAWDKASAGGSSTGSAEGDTARAARFAAMGQTSSATQDSRPSFSRCWFQEWAFNEIDNKTIAESLRGKFPQGCKMVSIGNDTFLEAVPARLSDEWSHCAAQEGMGLYPPGVGDCALEIQDRINDVASMVFESVDRYGGITLITDEDVVSSKALNGKVIANTITGVKRKAAAMNRSLKDSVVQIEARLDGSVFTYLKDLVMLAQLIAGIRPEIFGGSDPNVKTAEGQTQQLNQAIGRLMLYLEQMHEEHADRSEKAVKCQQKNMQEDLRHIVEGDTDSGFANEYILLSEMQGSFHAYAESDQGFPASFSEMKQQVVDMLAQAKDNPLVQEMMQVFDNQRLVASYAAPPGTKLPNESAISKVKRVIAMLATGKPIETQAPDGSPMYMPSELPDKDVDDPMVIKQLVLEWCSKNFMLQKTNPPAYENVKAYMKLAGQYQAEKDAAAAVTKQMVAAAGAPPQPGAPPAP